MLNEEMLEWMDRVGQELNEFLVDRNYNLPDVAYDLGIDKRAMQRMRNGRNEVQIRVAKTEYYALVYYHCNIQAADPTTLPDSRSPNKAWTRQQYENWKRSQGEPKYVSKADYYRRSVVQLYETLSALVNEESFDLIDEVSLVTRADIFKLEDILRKLKLPSDIRRRELQINRDVKLDIGGNRDS